MTVAKKLQFNVNIYQPFMGFAVSVFFSNRLDDQALSRIEYRARSSSILTILLLVRSGRFEKTT